jgi:biotin-dependent carboxylase-like uncharacterized protein
MIEVVEAGPLATVQDRGRRGYAALGVPRSGAFDRGAAALANRLVGNRADAAVIETTFGGLALRVRQAVTLALTGAPGPGDLDWGRATTVRAGALVRLGAPEHGVRSYLAVRGGIDVEPVLGSRSSDLLSGLGPAPLRPGDVLPIGSACDAPPSGAVATPASDPPALRVLPGPRADWFVPDALVRLLAISWRVRPESDRVGVRLEGPPLRRRDERELPSEAVLPGAVQVPGDGRPILFGPDAPVTGGYPVVAVVATADLDAAAQLRPGDMVRFDLGTGG